MTISKELLKGCARPEDLLGEAGLMKELKIKLMERMLGAELTAHLGYEEGKDAPPGQPMGMVVPTAANSATRLICRATRPCAITSSRAI
jgi:hypothetical protein